MPPSATDAANTQACMWNWCWGRRRCVRSAARLCSNAARPCGAPPICAGMSCFMTRFRGSEAGSRAGTLGWRPPGSNRSTSAAAGASASRRLRYRLPSRAWAWPSAAAPWCRTILQPVAWSRPSARRSRAGSTIISSVRANASPSPSSRASGNGCWRKETPADAGTPGVLTRLRLRRPMAMPRLRDYATAAASDRAGAAN